MKVAAVQFKPVFKDLVANIRTMGELAKQAAKGGAQLVVFPEMSTAGYSFMSEEEARPFSEPLLPEKGPSPSFDHLQQVSKDFNIAIAWGFIEDAQGKLFNSQCLVLPEGGYSTYRKRNRWANDFLWAAKGDVSPTILTWRGRTIGMLICRDIRDKSDVSPDLYEAGDADIVAFSANFGNGGFPPVSWVEFAEENKVNLIVSNRYGKEQTNNFGEGGVCIIRPSGKVNCKGLIWSQPCIIYDDV